MAGMRLSLRCAGLVVAAALGVAGGCSSKPDMIVVVTVAGLRADAVDRAAAPRIAGLGAPRIAAAPSPQTTLALAAFAAGRPPQEMGLEHGDLARLPLGATTLAEELKRRGFASAAFVGQADVTPLSGLARGFDAWSGPEASGDRAVSADEAAEVASRSGFTPAAELAAKAAAWLKERAGEKRLFLWVHFADIPAAVSFSGEPPRAGYGRGLAAVDAALGSLLDALDASGRKGRVLVVLSPHGLALGDEGETLAGLGLQESVLRAPFWIVGGRGPAGSATAPLTALRGEILARAGLGGAPAAAADVTATTSEPARFFGWPAERVVVGADGRAGRREGTPPTDAPALLAAMNRARAALFAGKGLESFDLYAEAAKSAPQASAPRLALLRLASALDPADRAARAAVEGAAAAEALQLAGDDPARLIDAAEALEQAGRNDEALAALRRAPTARLGAGGRAVLAERFAAAGSRDEALALLEPLAQAEPDAPELWELVGDLHNRAGNGFLARQAYEKALAAGLGRSANLVAKLGDALASLGDKDGALQRYAEAVKIDPSYRYPHSRAADILIEKKEYGAAAHAVVLSLPAAPDAVSGALLKGRALRRRGLLQAAAIELERGLKESPREERLTCELAGTLADGGARDKARELLSALLQGAPRSARGMIELARLEALEGRGAEALRLLAAAEPLAAAPLAARVRGEDAFAKSGDAALAAKARAFGGAAAK